MPALTVPDCTLEGRRIRTEDWRRLDAESLARIVGSQEPGAEPESAEDYDWRFTMLPLERLRCASQDFEEPEGGWEASYQRHAQADAEAVAGGSPDYAGRQEWLARDWIRDTSIYSLFVVLEADGFRV